MRILSIDVSGNFKEGKGTSGLAYMEYGEIVRVDEIRASDYDSAEAYWNAHVVRVSGAFNHVVMEGYKLYGHKKNEQVNSELETPQLIGVIKLACYLTNTPLTIQFASEVKSRWNDNVLLRKGILTRNGKNLFWKDHVTNTHKRDAIRHLLHFYRYKLNY